jgi:16S rRNA (adenine(1408)-N(1))-methyltransferase
MDVGTGDGRYPLLVARARADTFVIGIDPATDALAHAARRVARDRTPNVALIVGSVEAVACHLAGLADEVRVHFPWGSLLRGVIGEDDAVLAALARLPKGGCPLTALFSVVPRDGAAAMPDADLLAARWISHGLVISTIRPLTSADVEAAGSSWGKRLGAGDPRPGIYVRAVRSRR